MEDAITVCLRVREGKLPPVELSTRDVCSKCSKQVWISPATRQSIEMGLYPDVIVCVNCAMKLLPKD
ncbi:MAG: hypothetical protein HY517_02365 [Candidatus Aenigmarchaeota archaeon]|nr:hypothetical protein [Candidatus Aenigmarchaeota archaeon]